MEQNPPPGGGSGGGRSPQGGAGVGRLPTGGAGGGMPTRRHAKEDDQGRLLDQGSSRYELTGGYFSRQDPYIFRLFTHIQEVYQSDFQCLLFRLIHFMFLMC